MTCALFTKLQDAITAIVEDCTTTARVLSPEDLGLHPSSSEKIFVQDGCIIVKAIDDNNLQYYSGFEYVEKHHRLSLGNYVLYSSESDRVKYHLKNLITEH
jgi:hypothetical protein